MKQQFEVIAIENQTMTLKVNHSGGCASCSVNSGCGTGILANYFDKYSTFNKPLKPNVKVGDFIGLEINASMLFFRAFVLYILPLLVLFASTVIAQMLFPMRESVQIVFGISGFATSLLLIRYFWK